MATWKLVLIGVLAIPAYGGMFVVPAIAAFKHFKKTRDEERG